MFMEPGLLRIGDLDVHVTVSEKRRTVGLTVERDATVSAVVPHALDAGQLTRVVAAKGAWLHAKLRERAETGLPRRPREFVTGEGFPYLGRSYRLLVVEDSRRPVLLKRGRLELRRDCLDDAAGHLVRWYRTVGEAWLTGRVAPWSQRLSTEVADLRVLPLGYRWGSCTPDGRVNVDWATMQLPPDLIDYVLVHELAHVRHPDHGSEFWRAVDRAMPGWEGRRARLRRAGPDLWLPLGLVVAGDPHGASSEQGGGHERAS
jgi:predicted metal-dependent hydrolase